MSASTIPPTTATDPESVEVAVVAAGRRPILVLSALIAILAMAWILGTPRSAGPDEPGHHVRAGALVRGQLDGTPFDESDFHGAFLLPGHIGFPDPVCFAFNEFGPASCTNDLEPEAGVVPLGTRAADYPVWGHLLAGLGTFAPAGISAWTARVGDAVLPLALVIAAIWVAARRGPLGVGSVLMALTPMAWFMFAVVNPSGLVIAGGIGLWVALTAPEISGRESDRTLGLLAACSWAAMVLPRRDGLVWAALVVAFALLFGERRVGDHIRRLGRVGLGIAALATLATLIWASRSDTNAAVALFAAPLAPAVAVGARSGWDRISRQRPPWRWLVAPAAVIVVVVAGLAVMSRRGDGWDRRVLELVIGRTGQDLTEAIGNLGWLDTPVPTSAIFAWIAGLGALAGLAIATGQWAAIRMTAAMLGGAVFTSWTLTMLQNDESGEYWQGRYYLPFLVGIPIVLGAARVAPELARRIGVSTAVIGLGVANAAMFAMLRRFGVGRAGSLFPWNWDTYESPLPPVVILIVHFGASVGLVWWTSQVRSGAPEMPVS